MSETTSTGPGILIENPPAVIPAPATALPPQPPSGMGRVSIADLALLPDSERRTLWINSLVEAEVARQNYAHDRALAKEFAISGQFDDIKGSSPDQAIATAMVKIQLGRAWGFNAADSIRYIYFTNGRPAVENEIIAAKLQQAGYDWDVEWLEETVQHKGKPWKRCIGCKLWLKKWNTDQHCFQAVLDHDGKPVTVSFTEADADNAMIWEKGKQIPLSEKWNFKSWGRDMYFWRSIGRLKKYHAPHVLRGLVSREEALEIMPASEMPPDQLPRELAAPAVEVQPQEPAAKRPTAKDKILQQPSFAETPKQTSFAETPVMPPPELNQK